MDSFEIESIGTETADKVSTLFPPEIIGAIKEDLPVTALVAIADGMAVGGLAGAIRENAFCIDSLYVAPGFRRKGVATQLVDAVTNLLAKADEYLALYADVTALTQEDESLCMFFRKAGFSDEKVGVPCYYKTYLGEMNDQFQGNYETTYDLYSFAEVSDDFLSIAEKRCRMMDAPVPAGGFLLDQKSRILSYFVQDKNGIVRAFVIIDDLGGELLRVTSLWSDLKDPRDMMAMANSAKKEVVNRYKKETMVVALTLHELSEKMFLWVFPSAQRCSYSFVR